MNLIAPHLLNAIHNAFAFEHLTAALEKKESGVISLDGNGRIQLCTPRRIKQANEQLSITALYNSTTLERALLLEEKRALTPQTLEAIERFSIERPERKFVEAGLVPARFRYYPSGQGQALPLQFWATPFIHLKTAPEGFTRSTRFTKRRSGFVRRSSPERTRLTFS